MQPLDRSTIWPYRDGEPGDFYYQRYAHPTGVEAERALGELEGGEALLFPSGSGAITALVLAEVAPGQTIALAEARTTEPAPFFAHSSAGACGSSSSTRPARLRPAPTSSGSRRLRIRS